MDFLVRHHAALLSAPHCRIDDGSGVVALQSDAMSEVVAALARDVLKRPCQKRVCKSALVAIQHCQLPSGLWPLAALPRVLVAVGFPDLALPGWELH
eukprot:10435255-Alexandrium_andersonii.AAC.1